MKNHIEPEPPAPVETPEQSNGSLSIPDAVYSVDDIHFEFFIPGQDISFSPYHVGLEFLKDESVIDITWERGSKSGIQGYFFDVTYNVPPPLKMEPSFIPLPLSARPFDPSVSIKHLLALAVLEMRGCEVYGLKWECTELLERYEGGSFQYWNHWIMPETRAFQLAEVNGLEWNGHVWIEPALGDILEKRFNQTMNELYPQTAPCPRLATPGMIYAPNIGTVIVIDLEFRRMHPGSIWQLGDVLYEDKSHFTSVANEELPGYMTGFSNRVFSDVRGYWGVFLPNEVKRMSIDRVIYPE